MANSAATKSPFARTRTKMMTMANSTSALLRLVVVRTQSPGEHAQHRFVGHTLHFEFPVADPRRFGGRRKMAKRGGHQSADGRGIGFPHGPQRGGGVVYGHSTGQAQPAVGQRLRDRIG